MTKNFQLFLFTAICKSDIYSHRVRKKKKEIMQFRPPYSIRQFQMQTYGIFEHCNFPLLTHWGCSLPSRERRRERDRGREREKEGIGEHIIEEDDKTCKKVGIRQSYIRPFGHLNLVDFRMVSWDWCLPLQHPKLFIAISRDNSIQLCCFCTWKSKWLSKLMYLGKKYFCYYV